MAKIKHVVSSSGEDFVDELSSLTVTKYTNEVFKPFLEKLDKDDASIMDEALHGAISTLQFGIMSAVIYTVSEFMLSKSTFVLGGIFLWLKGTSAVKKTKNTASRIFSNLGKKTGLLRPLKTISDLVLGSEEQRLVMAQMTNDTSNQLMNNVSQERQNQILMKTATYKRQNSTLENAVSLRNKGRDSYIANHKTLMQTGGYKRTKQHKVVYEKATGQDLKSMGITWNDTYIKKLNSYSEFAKTSEGEIVNLVTTQLNFMASQGWEMKKNV